MAQLLVSGPSTFDPHSARHQPCPPTHPRASPCRSHQVCRASSLHVRPQGTLFHGSLHLTRARTSRAETPQQLLPPPRKQPYRPLLRDDEPPVKAAASRHALICQKCFYAQRACEGGRTIWPSMTKCDLSDVQYSMPIEREFELHEKQCRRCPVTTLLPLNLYVYFFLRLEAVHGFGDNLPTTPSRFLQVLRSPVTGVSPALNRPCLARLADHDRTSPSNRRHTKYIARHDVSRPG